MALGRLTDLQERVLMTLAPMKPEWTLSGGGALVGFHTCHREGFRDELVARVLSQTKPD